jgi:hypothetical protein
LPHFLLALTGAAWAVKKQRSVFFVVALASYALVIAAMLPFSSGLWSLPLLEMTQFPWRLLSITTVLQVLCLAGFAPMLKRLGRLSLPVVVILVASSAWWYSNQLTANPMAKSFGASELQELQELDAASLVSYSGVNEFLPRTASRITELSPLGTGSKISVQGGGAISADESTSHRIRFRTDIASDDAYVVIAQIYFPGWQVRVDGEQLAPQLLRSNLTDHGLIRVPIPRGSHSVEAWYDGAPGSRWRALLALLALLLIPVAIVVLHRSEQRRAAN